MKTLTNGTKVTVNGNSQAIIQSYDKGLDMYNVRMWSGSRHVGDIIVGKTSIKVNK